MGVYNIQSKIKYPYRFLLFLLLYQLRAWSMLIYHGIIFFLHLYFLSFFSYLGFFHHHLFHCHRLLIRTRSLIDLFYFLSLILSFLTFLSLSRYDMTYFLFIYLLLFIYLF